MTSTPLHPDWRALHREHRDQFAGAGNMVRLAPGRDPVTGLMSLPLRDEKGSVCGLWLMTDAPACVPGSKPGLIYPEDLDLSELPWELPLLAVTVGVPALLAAMRCGVRVVGLPSWGAVPVLVRMLASGAGQDVSVIVDASRVEPAVELCDALLGMKKGRVRFAYQPGMDRALALEMTSAPVVTKDWVRRARERLATKARAA